MAFELALDPRAIGAAITLLIIFFALYLTFTGFSMVGITPMEVILLLFIAPWVAWINIPIWRSGDVLFGINAAGAVIPIALSIRFISKERLPPWKGLTGVGAVTVVAYLVARVDPNQGVLVPPLPIVATALAAGLILAAGRWRQVGPITYAAGALGTLAGADLLNIPLLASAPRERTLFAVVGGAGTLDAIYLVALVAVLGSILVVAITRLIEGTAD
ncbi:MAG: DUF1614 domain-containing protein [Candidatus Thermoplasmatota archaeon]|nr:DUF1614 domain-containing protein [Candidatus Thermoplasmatota archaeon]